MAGRLSYTKSRLFSLTEEISARKLLEEGVSSSEVVDNLMNELKSIPDDEIKEVIRVGLMVLAGRVTSMNKSDVNQLDIFANEGFPIFVDLRIKGEDGKTRSKRYDVKKLTPNIITMHSPVITKNKTISKRDNLIGWAKRRIVDGFGDVSVEASR